MRKDRRPSASPSGGGSRQGAIVGLLALLFALAVSVVSHDDTLSLPSHSELSGDERILIIAPHPDDEVIAAGGLIHDALEAGSKVKVVLMTNGDGFTWAARRHFATPFVTSQEYVELGYRRQQESLDALATLGLGADDVTFLGYPDRGIAAIWELRWNCDAELYRSPYTRTTHTPYDNSHTQEAPYCGQSIVDDLTDVTRDFRPTLIVMPHPNDAHIDHWGTYNFATYAVATLVEQGLPPPRTWYYLAHRGDWPSPRGLYPGRILSPPPALTAIDRSWFRVPLSTVAIEAKKEAVGEYKTQVALLRRYLLSFVAQNELFSTASSTPLTEAESVRFSGGGTPSSRDAPSSVLDEESPEIVDIIENPARDTLKRRLQGSADILSFEISVEQDDLIFTIALRGKPSRAVTYDVWVNGFAHRQKGVTDRQYRFSFSPPRSVHVLGSSGRIRAEEKVTTAHITPSGEVAFRIPRRALGDPQQIFVGARTRSLKFTVDWTAWRMIDLSTLPSSAAG